MYKKIIWLFIIAAPFIANAQSVNLSKKPKDKPITLVNEREVMQSVPNDNSTAGTGTNANTNNLTAETTSPDSDTTLKSFSKFDFVPGEKIIYAEDFANDAVGELPLNWNTTGKGGVVSLSKYPGKWLRLFQNTTYLTGNKASFDKNFTVEFDLVLQFAYKSYTFPLIYFGLMSSNNLSSTDNSLLNNLARFQSAQMLLRPYTNSRSNSEFITYVDRQAFFKGTDQQLTDFESRYNKVSHVAMQVQGSRLRIWINSQKVIDAPRAISPAYTLNQLFFKIGNSGYKEDAIGFYVSNFKVATGLPDTRHKLINEGKFSTTGILFDVNAATIKPESAGVLKEISDALKSNAGIKVKITGHTDSDGADAANMELSRKRAEAVKAALAKDYSIEASRLTADGQGESKPVGDNKTAEGKAQNRRVEFTKL